MKRIPSTLLKSSTGKFIIPFILLACLFFFLASCVKNYFDFDKIADSKWTPGVALPMVYTSLTIDDIIKVSNSESNFAIGPDNFVTLVYKGNLFSLRADEIIILPDNSNTQDIYVPGPDLPVISSGGTASFSSSQTINFNTGGQTLIDSLIYKSGTLDITINSTIQHNVQINLSIPSLVKSGNPYFVTLPLNYSGSLPVTAASSLDLSGYTFDMTLGGTTTNQFNISYSITVNGISGNPISSSDFINVKTDFINNKFDKIYGYIGQQLLSPDLDTVHISLFDNVEEIGTFTLVDAKIKTIISNSYGVPIKANFTVLEGYRPGTGTFPVNGSGVPNPLPLPSPAMPQIGQVLKDSFELNNINSNVVQLINFQPKYFVYQLNSQSNPGGPAQNFVIDTSVFAVDLQIDMPLHGTAVVFTVQDTFDFDLPEGDDLDSLLLRIYVANGFPLEVGLQVYFVDTTDSPFGTIYTLLDSVLAPFQNILNSASIDVNGKAIGSMEKTIDQWFDSGKLKNIAKAKKIFVRGQMTTSNNGNTNVKIYSDYKLDVRIGAMAKLKQTISFH